MLIQRMRQRSPLGRRLQRGTSAAVLTLAVLGSLVLLNVAGARHHRRWDLTLSRSFSLAPQTLQVLSGLTQPVEVVAFPEPGSTFRAYLDDLLREYEYRAGGRLRHRFVDPDALPAVAQQYGVTAYNTVVVSAGQRQERIDGWDLSAPPGADGQPQWNGEAALSSAIQRAAQARQRRIYFLQGHAERDGEMTEAKKQLADAGYAVVDLSLLQQPAVPADADALVIAGPRHDLSAQEAGLIGRWADDGGRLLLMADPAAAAQPQLAALAVRLGVRLEPDRVVDPAAHYRFDPAAVVPAYDDHAITGRTQASQMRMLLPAARSLALLPGAWEATPLLESSEQAWGQADPAAAPGAAAAPGDRRGPLRLAAALERKGAQGQLQRAVVVGSAAFATDAAARLTPANGEFVLESLRWLTSGEGVTIPPKAVEPARLFLTGGQAQLLLYGTAVALPLAAFAAGGAIWLRRRHL